MPRGVITHAGANTAPPPVTVADFATTLSRRGEFVGCFGCPLTSLAFIDVRNQSQGGEEATRPDELAAARAGEADAKAHAAILQKTLDASVELCKRAEATWEARHEEHCKEVRTH